MTETNIIHACELLQRILDRKISPRDKVDDIIDEVERGFLDPKDAIEIVWSYRHEIANIVVDETDCETIDDYNDAFNAAVLADAKIHNGRKDNA